MKRYIIIKIILTILLSVIGGTAVAEKHNQIKWGVQTSFDVELPGKWHGENADVNMFKPGYGLTVGCVSHIYIGSHFYFEPELSIFYAQYKYKDLVITGDDGNTLESDPKLHKWGIQVPLVFGYSFDFPMNVFTGPQIRYAFAGSVDIKNKKLIEGMEDDFDLWGINGQRRFGCSWTIGIGFPIKEFILYFKADFGITNLLKGDMMFRENRFGLGITYYF